MTDDTERQPQSLLPYDEWAEEAMRHVMVRALQHVAAEGLPGEHHFYITFRTNLPGVVIPDRMRAQYPEEMTIVLQHQFWDLAVDEATHVLSVGLSFGGVATKLRIPFGAVTQFVDPHIRYGLRFDAVKSESKAGEAKAGEAKPEKTVATLPAVVETKTAAEPKPAEEEAQVVSLDAFRRRPPTRES